MRHVISGTYRKKGEPISSGENKGIQILNENGCKCPEPGRPCCVESVRDKVCPIEFGKPPRFQQCEEKRKKIIPTKEEGGSVCVSLENLENTIKDNFSKKLSPGLGAVITIMGGGIVPYGDIKEIDNRDGEGFLLDHLCVGARNICSLVYAVFYPAQGNLCVEKVKGNERIFERINREVREVEI